MRIESRNMRCVFEMDSRLVHTLEEAGMDATFILCIASARRLPILGGGLAARGAKVRSYAGVK
jgi:hypothetical protein